MRGQVPVNTTVLVPVIRATLGSSVMSVRTSLLKLKTHVKVYFTYCGSVVSRLESM